MNFALWPESASTVASEIDLMFIALSVFTLLWGGGIVAVMVYFLARYRRSSRADRTGAPVENRALEWGWITVTAVIGGAIFVWSVLAFLGRESVPQDAYEVRVLAKQWMWKFYHPDGRREIDELHVPVDRPVVLRMQSQDVVHSFFVPAFRVKNDVLPQRYTTTWFEATKTGRYALFCAEYCGTQHAAMTGVVVVQDPVAFEAWLAERAPRDSLVARGRALFMKHGCSGCHEAGSAVQAPRLDGVYGQEVTLVSGEVVRADESYLREAILVPQKHVVAGYAPIMPSFAGQLSDEELLSLVAYLKSLGGP